jgi:ubiquinone/menaquinone biosynthesis C-methylase UbiE
MQQNSQDIPSLVDAYEAIFVPAMLDPMARLTVDHFPIHKGENLMDLACGTGIAARHAAPLIGENGKIVAVDSSPEMLAKARTLTVADGAPIEWRQGDAMNLDVPDGTLDIILCQQGLQYLSDPAACVAECRRTLNKQGRVAFSTWRSLEHAPLFKKLVAVEARHLKGLGVTYEELAAPFLMDNADELHVLLEVAGFEDVSVIELPLDARFPSAAHFVRDVEIAYASVMPQFIENPSAFWDFVEEVERDMRDAVEHHRDGTGVRFTMKAHLTTAAVNRSPGERLVGGERLELPTSSV